MTVQTEHFATVKSVLRQILWLNLIVAALKIAVGLWSGLLSMVADGFHSLMDGSSNIIGLVALRIAQAPPDSDHPYGHRKAETIASMFIGVLLLFTTVEILRSAITRLGGSELPRITTLGFGVMLFTLLVNLFVTVYERRKGQALHSEILLADAEHTRSDMLVSLSVIGGMVGIQFGLVWLDGLIAFGIAGLIGYSALKILWQASNVLMDQATLPQQDIEQLALSLPEVQSVERIRSRGREDETYVDLHVRVRPDIPTDYAHSIAHAVQDRIKDNYPQTKDVTVHIEPEPDYTPFNTSRQIKAIAYSLGVEAHDVWMYRTEAGLHVELHIEVPPNLSLTEAHHVATAVEKECQKQIPELSTITTHIEPMGQTLEDLCQPSAEMEADLKAQVQAVTSQVYGADVARNVNIRYRPQLLTLSLNCALPSNLPITEAHQVSQKIEDAIRQNLPDFDRVTVHVEPGDSDA